MSREDHGCAVLKLYVSLLTYELCGNHREGALGALGGESCSVGFIAGESSQKVFRCFLQKPKAKTYAHYLPLKSPRALSRGKPNGGTDVAGWISAARPASH